MQRRKILTSIIIAVMLSPIILDMLSAVTIGGLSGDVLDMDNLKPRTPERPAAIKDRARARKQTREFWQAMEEYQHRVKDGEEGLVPPDINDYQSILKYIRDNRAPLQPDTSDGHSSAETSEAGLSSLEVSELGEEERHLLRRYQKANSCPDTLKNYWLEGFYDLCVSVTANPAGEARRGLLNPRQWMNREKEVKAPTLKLRLEMLNQALDRSTRRESTEPGRPTPYVKD